MSHDKPPPKTNGNKTMSKDKVKTYAIGEDRHSGLELELQFMPRFFIDNHGNPMLPHTHGFYQIIWFRRGHGTHMVDFVDYPVNDNTIFFIAPGQIHAFDHNTDYQGVVIHFNASFMVDEESSESMFLKYNVFNAYDSLPCCNITADEEQRLLGIVNEMNREYALTGAFAHKDYMRCLLRLFLIRVQRGGERKEVPKLYVTSVANRTFVRFRQLLENNFRTIHTVQEYASLLNVSARSLTNYVRQSAHRSPLQIINDRIVLEAKRQLQNSTMSIKEIGYQLGFDDPSYFVKFFKRQTGYIPSEARAHSMATAANTTHINNNMKDMKQRIAIPTSDGKLFPHFGKAPQVTVFDIDDGKVVDKQVLTAPEHAHGAMPRFLQGLGVTDVVCGGLGTGAVTLLNQMDIAIHGGAPAINVDELIEKYISGSIVYGDSSCHHDSCGGEK